MSMSRAESPNHRHHHADNKIESIKESKEALNTYFYIPLLIFLFSLVPIS